VLGAYGASRSIYIHSLSRGKNVVLPQDTEIEIAMGRHHDGVQQVTTNQSDPLISDSATQPQGVLLESATNRLRFVSD